MYAMAAAGGRPGDWVHGGAELLGCTVIPASSGHTHRQITLLSDLKPAGIKSTPSYALHLAETAAAAGVNPRSFGLRWGIFGAEPWSEPVQGRGMEFDTGIIVALGLKQAFTRRDPVSGMMYEIMMCSAGTSGGRTSPRSHAA